MSVRGRWVLALMCAGAFIAPSHAQDSAVRPYGGLISEDAAPTQNRLFVPDDEPSPTLVDSKATKTSLYPKIYQGPLFGSLFSRSLAEQKVDETALRYYASLHNVARVEAEIRRLKALYPNWLVPTNIYSSGGACNDEQPFWDLFAADRMEELHAGIALRMKGEPGWKPSRDLVAKIERKEAVDRLVKASNVHAWNDALEIANSQPSVLHCAYIDADWRVAEAFIGIGAATRAFEVYHAIIATCTDHEERLATVRKSIALFSVDEVKSLIALGVKSSDGAGEFDAVKNDLSRARIGAVNAGRSREVIEEAALSDLFADIDRTREKSDLALAGWYEFGRGKYAQADRWFTLGLPAVQPSSRDEDEKFAEGHALALTKLGRADEARKFAWEWRNASKAMRDLYVGAMIELLTRADPPPSVPDAALDDFISVVTPDRSFSGAQALAWYHQNRKDWDNSALWFKSALDWRGIDAHAPPAGNGDRQELAKAIEGYVIALDNLGRFDEALDISDVWRQENLALRGLFIAVVTEILNQTEKTVALSTERIDHYAQAVLADHSVNGAQNLGWLSYRSNDWNQSIDWFGKAIAWSANGKGDAKINEGYALALKGAGRLAEAEDVAWAWRDQSSDLRSAYIGVMVIQLSRDDLRGKVSEMRVERFARLVRQDRSSEGAQALGWYRLQQVDCGYAVGWFRQAIAWTADHQGDAKMNEGLAQALRAVGRFGEAEDVAWAWRERSPDLRALYIKVVADELTREWPRIAMKEERMNRFAQIVLADKSSVGAQALAWRRFGEPGCGYGVEWSRLATSWSNDGVGDAKMNEGYALMLRGVGRLSEAEAIAWPWVDKVAAMKKLYIDLVVDDLARDNPPEPMAETRIVQFVATIEPSRSALGAQALGWYRYERHEDAEAAKWFKNALDWWPQIKNDPQQKLASPADGYVAILAKLAMTHEAYRPTPRAYPNTSTQIGKALALYVDTLEGLAKTTQGYALALRTLGRIGEAEAIAWDWRDRWASLRALFLEVAISELGRPGGEAISAERLERYAAVINADRSIAGAQALGWYGYARKDFAAAAEWFKASLDWVAADPNATPDPKIVEAYVLSLRGAKRFSDALDVVSAWRDKIPALRPLYFETALVEIQNSGKGAKVSAEKFAQMEAAITESQSFDGASAIGWMAYQQKDYARALKWFRQAIVWTKEPQPDPKTLEGLALTLRSLGQIGEFATFAYEWRDASPDMHQLYVGGMVELLTRADPAPAIPDAAIETFETVVTSDQSLDGAQALAWHAANKHDWSVAATWFKTGLDWANVDPLKVSDDPKLAKVAPKMVEGYVLALKNLSRHPEAEDIAYAWRDEGEILRGLYVQVFVEEINKTDPPPQIPADRMERFAQFVLADRSVVGAQNLGWLSYRSNDWNLSIDWFTKAIAWSPNGKGDAKINEGYALALKGAGRLDEAEEVAWAWRDQSTDLRGAYFGVMVIELSRDDLRDKVSDARIERFAHLVRQDHAPEGAQALGWFHLHQANCGYAVGWFRFAIDWSADHQGDAKMNEGLAQALRNIGRFNEAEDVAYVWRDRSADLRALYVKIVVEELTREWPKVAMDEERMNRFSQFVLADKSSVGAQALGWRRYGDASCGYGVDWFRLATIWSSDGIGDAKMNEGYALTLRAVGRLSEAEAIAWPWIEKVAAMKKLYVDVVVAALSRDNPPEPMPETRVTQFMATIEPIHSALGAQALGWYRYERHENAEAAKWFKNALDWWPPIKNDAQIKLTNPVEKYVAILAKLALRREDYQPTPRAYPNTSTMIGKTTDVYVNTLEGLANTIEGYAMTLRALGRIQEAQAIAWEWRDRWPGLRALFIEIAITELVRQGGDPISAEWLERYASVINADHSTRGAQALGWHGYARQDFTAAAEWFKASLDWSASDPKAAPDGKIVEAYVLSLRGAKRFAEALNVVTAWRDKLPDLKPLFIQVGMEEAATLDPATPAGSTKLLALASAISASKSADGAAAFGWIAYQRKDFATAMQWFKQAIVWAPDNKPDDKALEGFALSLHSLGKTADLLTFSYQWSEHIAAMKPIFIDAVVDALANAQANGIEIAPEVLVRASAAFAEVKSVVGAQALAWQRINAKDWVTAAAWFKAAMAWSPDGVGDAKLAEGLTIALRNLSRFDEAQALAYSWAGRSDEMRALYIEIIADRLTRKPPSPPSDDEMRRFAAVVSAKNSANGAQALGWYSYNAKQGRAAVAWFERAMAWEPSEDSALGLAFAYRLLRDRTAYFQTITAYRDRYGKIADLASGRMPRSDERRAAFESAPQADLGVDEPIDEPRVHKKHASAPRSSGGGALATALHNKDYIGCIKTAEAKASDGALSASDEQMQGWCLLGLARSQEAAIAFDRALAGSHGKAREDAAYGKSLALLQNNQTQPAVAAAGEAELSPERRHAIGVEVLSRRAYGAYEGKRYVETIELLDRRAQFAPETRELMSLRAWSLKNIGRGEEAAKIFRSIDAQLSTSQTNAAVSVTTAVH